MKYMKAYKCYCCGEIHEAKRGETVFAKKYSHMFDGLHRDIAICHDCMTGLVHLANQEKEEREDGSTEQSEM